MISQKSKHVQQKWPITKSVDSIQHSLGRVKTWLLEAPPTILFTLVFRRGVLWLCLSLTSLVRLISGALGEWGIARPLGTRAPYDQDEVDDVHHNNGHLYVEQSGSKTAVYTQEMYAISKYSWLHAHACVHTPTETPTYMHPHTCTTPYPPSPPPPPPTHTHTLTIPLTHIKMQKKENAIPAPAQL